MNKEKFNEKLNVLKNIWNKEKNNEILNNVRNVIKKINIKYNEIMEWKNTRYIMLVTTIIFFIMSFVLKQKNLAAISITIPWIYNVFYGLRNIKQRFMFLIMNFMLFTFILARPFINIFINEGGWYFTNEAIWKAMMAIGISEISLLLGNQIAEQWKVPQKKVEEKLENDKIIIFNKILFVVFILTAISSLYVEISQYINLKNLSYSSVYINNSVEFPIIVRIFSTLFAYSVFACLAMMPNKKKTLIILGTYILIGVPSFLLGSRNSLISRILFSMVYIFIRNVIDQKDNVWISKKTKIITIAMIPIVIIFLGAYNYIRNDEKIKTINPISIVVDFFHKQATTFYTVCQGFEYEEYFKEQPNVISYTFGDIIDYIFHNTISQKIFGAEDLGNGNSMKMVELSNSMAHKLSYVILGQASYLAGHGRGTSYIIETYMDAGIIWVAIYSMIIGIYLEKVIYFIKNSKFLTKYIVLTSLYQIFLIPRYSASGFITFIVTPQFWIIPILILGIDIIINLRKKGEIHE